MVSFLCCLSYITEIAGDAVAHAKDTGLLVQNIQNRIDVLALFVADELDNSRIHIAASGTHNQTLKWGKTHGGIYTLAADGCGDTCSVAQVTYDNLALFRVKLSELQNLAGYEQMAGAMEAVTTDAVFIIVLIGDCIEVCLLRHLHTESGIPYCYVRSSGHSCLACLDTHQVRRVMQRSKVEALADYALYVLVNYDRIAVNLSAVQNAVSDCRDLLGILDYTVLRIYQCLHNQLDCFGMCRHSLLDYHFLAVCLMCQLGTFDSDSLAETLCHYGLILHIDQLIFQRGASAVDY